MVDLLDLLPVLAPQSDTAPLLNPPAVPAAPTWSLEAEVLSYLILNLNC